ncbi:MAG: hypothetical protein JKY42_09750, partial [Flavobacteriales bacterium]|nr:hypothetical protein [Flavobacteriales bacterium]
MDSVVKRLKRFSTEQPTFVNLGKELLKIDFKKVNYKPLLPKIESQDNYARNILTFNPIEIILIVWPTKTESAI